MGDDLDQLLDEVERRFCGRVSVSGAAPGGSSDGQKSQNHEEEEEEEERKGSSTQYKIQPNRSSDNLDVFLDKLLEEESTDFTPKKTEASPKAAAVVRKVSGGRKCCPVFIGGSSVQSGIGTTMSKRSCDQLRCTSCDYSVLTFDDCEWDDCQYLFFRNNFPEQPKLQSKLRRRRGFRAYCCQCSWTSVSELTKLKLTLTPPLQWVCAGKHQD